MAATSSPVEVGTRGTIGSLVSQEMEYFKKLDLDGKESSRKPKIQIVDDVGASSSSNSRSKLGFESPTCKKKMTKATGSGGFLPSICSVVEIADNSRRDGIGGAAYRNLRFDEKKPPRH